MAAALPPHIATSSADEGLDFAASLLTQGLHAQAAADPDSCSALLCSLATYIQLRYVGEAGLALEKLAALARDCKSGGYRHDQFWEQVAWVAKELGYSVPETPPANAT